MKTKSIFSAVAHSRGGIHVPYHKNTAQLPAKRMPAPERIVLPMAQSIGAPCEPLVKKGDKVKVGQKIGDTEKFMSAPVHASVSGTVTEVVSEQPSLLEASRKMLTNSTLKSLNW